MKVATLQTPAEILQAARDLIADPARWTQNEAARDAAGKACASGSERAVCWCSIGAMNRNAHSGAAHRQAEVILSRTIAGSTAIFNDTHTHAEVLAAFDRAIAVAKEAA